MKNHLFLIRFLISIIYAFMQFQVFWTDVIVLNMITRNDAITCLITVTDWSLILISVDAEDRSFGYQNKYYS